MRRRLAIVGLLLGLTFVSPASTFAQAAAPAARAPANSDWTEPFPPFHIAGNLYYVGSKGLRII